MTDKGIEAAMEIMDAIAYRHQADVARLPRPSIAMHLRQWHGTRRQETPPGLLSRWPKEQLLNTHAEFHSAK